MAGKVCVRCGAEVFGRAEDQPHLCKDIAKRLARRERQRDVVQAILEREFEYVPGDVATEIVVALAGMGVTEDA